MWGSSQKSSWYCKSNKMNFRFTFFVIFAQFFRLYCNRDIREATTEDDVEKVHEILYDMFRNQILLKEILIESENESNVPGDDPHILLDFSLHFAVTKKAPGVVRLLLEYGADVNVEDEFGRTPLHLIAQEPYYHNHGITVVQESKLQKVTEILLEYKPDVHLRDEFSYTPFMYAVCFNYVTLVEKLLARGCSINERYGINGETPLHMAVNNGHLEMTKFLLENGANATTNDGSGENALHMIFDTSVLHGSAIGKLLLRSGGAEEMLKQKRGRDQKTPVDIFFEQSELDRDILMDLLKILPKLDDKYALTALRIFHPSLEEDSSTWPADNFLGYVKFAFNKYLEVLNEGNSKKISYVDGLSGKLRRLKGKSIDEIPAKSDVEHFVEHGMYSLYVILKIRYQIPRRNRNEAAKEVEEFEECLGRQSVLFQNDLVNSVAKGTALEILPTHILSCVFLRLQCARYILRLTKIMALVQLTRGWSAEEMTDVTPELINYVKKRDIFCL